MAINPNVRTGITRNDTARVDPGKVEQGKVEEGKVQESKVEQAKAEDAGVPEAATKAPVSKGVQTAARGRAAAMGNSLQTKLADELKGKETNQATALQSAAEANGLKSNQDLINHGYREATQGLKNSEENFAKAGEYLKQNYNVDINKLVQNRAGEIDGLKKPEAEPAKAEAKAEAKPEVKTEAQGTQEQAKAEAKTEAKAEAKAEAKTEAQAQAKTEAQTEAKTEAKGEQAKAEAEKTAQPEVSQAAQDIAQIAEAAESMGIISPELRKGLSDGHISREDLDGADAAYVGAQAKTNEAMASGTSAQESEAVSEQGIAAALFDDVARQHFTQAGAAPETMEQLEKGLDQVEELEKADQAVHGLSIGIKKGLGS